MSPRIEQSWMLNEQYQRMDRLEERIWRYEKRLANDPHKGTLDTWSGHSDGRTENLLGLKSVSRVFSCWDCYLYDHALHKGAKESIRKQYFYPWWKDQEGPDPIHLGGIVPTLMSGFSINASFEVLSRLTFTTINFGESILNQAADIAALNAWRSTFEPHTQQAVNDIRGDLQRYAAEASARETGYQTDQERLKNDVNDHVVREVRAMRREQSDVLMRYIEDWVIKGAIQQRFETLVEQFHMIMTSTEATKTHLTARMDALEEKMKELQRCLDAMLCRHGA